MSDVYTSTGPGMGTDMSPAFNQATVPNAFHFGGSLVCQTVCVPYPDPVYGP